MRLRRVDPSNDDASLVRAIAHGEPGAENGAETELYRRLAPRVRLYGLRHLRDPEAAADLAQQVLLMVIEKVRVGALREPEKLGSFALGIARMMVRDQRRKASRQAELLRIYGPADEAVDPAEPNGGEVERVAACMDRLSERERSVLILTFFEDRPAEDVGRELGVTPGNARLIRHRALQRLRDCMRGGGDE